MRLPAALCCLALSGLSLLASDPAPATFGYVLQADALARTKLAAVAKLAASGREWIVLDSVFSSETPWTRADLTAIRERQPARKIIAYLSIGEAEDYRPYWRPEWLIKGRPAPGAPAFLGLVNPAWKGNYRVKYWLAEWQRIVLASVDAAMEAGFDGVYLDIVDAFEGFEQEGADFIDDRVNPETKQSYRRDMVDWVKAIRARAHARNPSALIIPQNGSQLLAHPDFLAAIDAIGIEDLFTEGNKLQPASHTIEVLGHLKTLATARKPALLIEYPKSAERRAFSKRRAHEVGAAWLITDRQLKTLGISGH